MSSVIKLFNRIGYKANMPQEMIFLENFYNTQTLSCKKLQNSSFVDPKPQATVFTELPSFLEYYISRWEHLNLFSSFSSKDFSSQQSRQKPADDPSEELAEMFMNTPQKLLDTINEDAINPMKEIL